MSGLYQSTPTRVYAYLYENNNNFNYLVVADTGTNMFYTWPMPMSTKAYLGHAYFFSNTKSYYVGWTLDIVDNVLGRSYGTNEAYIMSYDLSDSCISYTYYYISTALTAFSGLISLTPTVASQTLKLVSYSITLYDMVATTNPIKNNWCTPKYTITSPTLSYDPHYYAVGTAAITITVHSFTIP